MPTSRRLWDSCVVIGYLAGEASLKNDCESIISQAKRGEIEIAVSTLAQAEVAYLKGYADWEAEQRIREFFGRDYIISIAFDIPVAAIARQLIRTYRTPSLKPPDAIHLATARLWGISLIETVDPDLLQLNQREGTPPITIRRPLYEGPSELPGFR